VLSFVINYAQLDACYQTCPVDLRIFWAIINIRTLIDGANRAYVPGYTFLVIVIWHEQIRLNYADNKHVNVYNILKAYVYIVVNLVVHL